jgi:trans-aconitate methyltransferase
MTKQVIGAEIYGVDISQHQLDIAIKTFPELSGFLEVGDVTEPLVRSSDFVYANAVTMHLGSKRVNRALTNMIDAANKAVFLIENWSGHDYQAFCDTQKLNYHWVEEFGVKGLLITTDS